MDTDGYPGHSTPAHTVYPLEQSQRRGATAAGTTTFGVDVHPTYQAGLDIEKVAREGFGFLAVKASQGTSDKWSDGAKSWCDRGDAAGMVTWVYHYLTTADVTSQARTAKAAAAGRPVMLDVETGSGNIDTVRGFCQAAASIGLPVPLLYLPRWYWQQIGSPSLVGLPPLVASHYTPATGYASSIYTSVPSSWWTGYGSATVAILQFTDKASVAGQKIDADAYPGSRDDLRALVYGSSTPAAPTLRPTLREGDMSVRIWELQRFLNDTFPSYSRIAAGPGPTSTFGPVTAAVVREFQFRVHLTPDGVVGAKTWAELERYGLR